MFDPGACVGMSLGAPRVTLAALAECISSWSSAVSDEALGTIRPSSKRRNMKNLPAPAVLSTAPRQLSISFDSARLRGMSPSERRAALAQLAGLLLEAANIAAEEGDDDQR